MTGIVPYATNPRFMAKKIPQSDLLGAAREDINLALWNLINQNREVSSPLPHPLSKILVGRAELWSQRQYLTVDGTQNPNRNLSTSELKPLFHFATPLCFYPSFCRNNHKVTTSLPPLSGQNSLNFI